MNRMEDFVAAMETETTPDGAWKNTCDFLEHHGAEWITYGVENLEGSGKSFILRKNTYPDEWNRHYADNTYMPDDYIIRHCRTKTDSLYFGIEWPYEGLSPAAETIRREIAAFGCRSGFAIPLRMRPHSGKAGIGFSNCMKHREFSLFMRSRRDFFHASLAYAHASMMHLAGSLHPTVTLTAKQRECLLWAAKGLKNGAIAERMGISEQMVYQHLKPICRKLGATRRIDAVAKAITLGLIKPG